MHHTDIDRACEELEACGEQLRVAFRQMAERLALEAKNPLHARPDQDAFRARSCEIVRQIGALATKLAIDVLFYSRPHGDA
jgi:hypothetical protein